FGARLARGVGVGLRHLGRQGLGPQRRGVFAAAAQGIGVERFPVVAQVGQQAGRRRRVGVVELLALGLHGARIGVAAQRLVVERRVGLDLVEQLVAPGRHADRGAVAVEQQAGLAAFLDDDREIVDAALAKAVFREVRAVR